MQPLSMRKLHENQTGKDSGQEVLLPEPVFPSDKGANSSQCLH